MLSRRKATPRARVRAARSWTVAIVATLAGALALAAPLGASSAAAPRGPGALRSEGQAPAAPVRPQSNVGLSDGRLRQAVANLRAGRAAPTGIKVRSDKVLVEVRLDGAAAAVRQAITGFGGDVTGQVGNELLEAYVPYGNLVALERTAGVAFLRAPLEANAPVSAAKGDSAQALTGGQEVVKTNAAAWQAAGITGAGVKVGIVDYYDQTKWNAALAAGDVPAAAGNLFPKSGADRAPPQFHTRAPHRVAGAGIGPEKAPRAPNSLACPGTPTHPKAGRQH